MTMNAQPLALLTTAAIAAVVLTLGLVLNAVLQSL
jgi:hypothetical protein